MSAIDEGIVREYFEQNGFFVRQVRKYQVQARRKTGEEEIDLLVYNPTWRKGGRAPDFFLFPNELPFVHRAIVAVKPWHTDIFTPAMLKSSPEIFGFLEQNVLKQAVRLFPSEGEGAGEGVTKILVLPALPTAEPFRSQSVEMLKERGVDAIISFRSMLLDLVEKIEANRSYGKSDTLQVIRVLKHYDLFKDVQMDLLPTVRRLSAGFGDSRADFADSMTVIHPTAIIEKGAQLGADCEIQAYAIVKQWAVLGDRVQVHHFAAVGGDSQDLKFNPATVAGVRIGAGTRIRESVTVHRATHPGGFTKVGENCLLMACSHVAHDCVVGRNVVIANAVLLAGHVTVGDNAILGGGAGFHQFVRVGEGTMVGGNARITLDIPPFTLAAERDRIAGLNLIGLRRRGVPAESIRQLKEAFRRVYSASGRIQDVAAAALAGGAFDAAEARRFLEFFAGGKRGFARPDRGQDDAEAE